MRSVENFLLCTPAEGWTSDSHDEADGKLDVLEPSPHAMTRLLSVGLFGALSWRSECWSKYLHFDNLELAAPDLVTFPRQSRHFFGLPFRNSTKVKRLHFISVSPILKSPTLVWSLW